MTRYDEMATINCLLSIEKQSISHTIHGQWHIWHLLQFMKSSSLSVNILYLDGLGPSLNRPTQTMHYCEGIPSQITIHLHCLIPPQMGNLMTPA